MLLGGGPAGNKVVKVPVLMKQQVQMLEPLSLGLDHNTPTYQQYEFRKVHLIFQVSNFAFIKWELKHYLSPRAIVRIK